MYSQHRTPTESQAIELVWPADFPSPNDQRFQKRVHRVFLFAVCRRSTFAGTEWAAVAILCHRVFTEQFTMRQELIPGTEK
jgi:hypothetical protein